MTTAARSTRLVAVACAGIGLTMLGITGCNSSSSKSASSTAASVQSAAAAGATSAAAGATSTVAEPAPSSSGSTSAAAAAGTVPGQPDLTTICPKLPIADAQALITSKLPAAVPDGRLGGCTFVLPGNQLNDNNLTVIVDQGQDAAGRYTDDTKGVTTIGTATMSTGDALTTPLSGVGDKAVWGAAAGYPTVSALKGDVYCNISTADDATKLTIIGSPNNPLPQGTPAQQAQYAQLEGKLCSDLFALTS
jgi:hypothetical protein